MKFFFAWVSAQENFSASVHAREDEDVFDLEIEEREGEFTIARVTIQNPRVGLLSPARLQRCFISCETSTGVELIFSGRVVGIPATISDETVDLEFIASPEDLDTQIANMKDSLKSSPRFHKALVSDENDISEILESFHSVLNFNRVTNAAYLSSVGITDGSSVIDVTDSVFENSFEINFTSAPQNACEVELDITYTQTSPVFSRPYLADPGSSASGIISNIFGGKIQTLTGEDFADSWFEPGTELAGYTVFGAYLQRDIAGKYTRNIPVSVAPPRDPSFTGQTYPVEVFISEFSGNLVLGGFYEQPRNEVLKFRVESDLQDLIIFGSAEKLSLSANGEDIAPDSPLLIQTTFKVPDDDSDTFTTRTQTLSVPKLDLAFPALAKRQAFEPVLAAALARAEAFLVKSARCISCTFEMKFEDALSFDTNSVLKIQSDKIPGGEIIGKVVGYKLIASGDGSLFAEIEMGASIGRGSALSYVSGSIEEYSSPAEPAIVSHCRSFGADDGTRLFSRARVRNSLQSQIDALDSLEIVAETNRFAAFGYLWAQEINDEAAKNVIQEKLIDMPTEIDANFIELESQDETVVNVTANIPESMTIFKSIDMET